MQTFKDSIHNKFVGKSMAKGTQTGKEAEKLFLSLKNKDFDIPDEAFDLSSAKGKVAFGKFKASLKKGELTDKLAFHLYNENTHHKRKSIARLFNIKPIQEFGTNYAEFYRDGVGAIEKLLNEKQGQGWNENGVKIGKNKWVVTAFDNSKLQSEKQGSNSASLTKGETLPLNSKALYHKETLESTKKDGDSVILNESP